MTDLQPVPEQRLQNLELMDFANFAKLPKKTELLDHRGFELMEMRKAQIPAPPPANPHL